MLTIKRSIWKHYIAGDVLRQQRLAVGMSQAELARRLGNKINQQIGQKSISRLEDKFEFGVEADIYKAIQECLK